MCAQPPLNRDDIDFFYAKNIEIIDNAPNGLTNIGITGGEPTLLEEKLIQSPNQKIPDRKTKCVIETHLNIKQNVIFDANLKPV